MKILFDARHIKNVYSGLARYTHSILNALIKLNNFEELEIILDKNEHYKDNSLFEDIYSKKTAKHRIIFLDAPLFKYKHHITVSKYVNNSNCDIYFYPHFDMPIFIKKKSIFVIHDLLPLIVNGYILKHKFLKQRFFKNLISLNLAKRNTKCIAVSYSTKNDILNIINKKYDYKIDVVYEDSFDCVINSNKINIEVNKVINSKYLFYIGDRRPHKNLKEMIDIFDILRNKFNYEGYFIIAGSEKNFNINIDEYIKNKPYVKTIGKVSDDELSILYKNMDALFFLSKYEGFGLPIIEAAKFNKRIIICNKSSCEEIAPNTALKIDLDNSIELKSKFISNYLTMTIDINNYQYLKNYSWSKSVENIFFKDAKR